MTCLNLEKQQQKVASELGNNHIRDNIHHARGVRREHRTGAGVDYLEIPVSVFLQQHARGPRSS